MPVVFDISSDEEEGLEGGLSIPEPDYEWIREFLHNSDDDSVDSDEVVVIDENKPELKSKSSTLAVKDVDGGGGDDDDDDCVVLESDPEKGVDSVAEETDESDELVVTGEKGQIACRDYPHARHLCAKFPFSSTPHEKHCSQCHCYVCESIAPCYHWGTGMLTSDHCHANDKTEQWKIQRSNFKLGQASTNFGTSSFRPGGPQHKEFLPLGVTNLSPNSVLPNQASRSPALCTRPSLNSIPQIRASWPKIPCSLSASSPNSSVQNEVCGPINTPITSPATNITMPNGAKHGRSQESRSTFAKNRCQPAPIPRPVLGVRSHAIQRERGNGASSLRPVLLHPHMMSSNFRPQVLRPHMMSNSVVGAGNTLMANKSSHGSSGFSNHVNMTQQHVNYHTAIGLPNFRNHNGPDNVCRLTNIPFCSQPSSQPASLSHVSQHTVASGTQAYSQPLPESNNSQDLRQTRSQLNTALSCFAVHLNSSQHGNEAQIRSENGNAGENTTQCRITSQDTCQPQPHGESARETAENLSASDSSGTDNIGQTILQNLGSVSQPPNFKYSSAQHTGSNAPPIECSQIPSSFVEIDNWLLDKDPYSAITDGFLSSLDIFPSDMDMGLFYLDGK